MTQFKRNLAKARGSIVFLIGITLAFGTVFGLEKWNPSQGGLKKGGAVSTFGLIEVIDEETIPRRAHRQLTEAEMQMATIAWTYFENNTNEKTGLVNSVDGYTAATLWDTASYLLAVISAYDLEIIDSAVFEKRMTQVLNTLAELPLFEGKLPNKAYSTATAEMTTYDNESTERGIGWSTIDIGRIMVPFNVLVWQYPQFTQLVGQVLSSWDLQALSNNGEMIGTAVDPSDETLFLQEGRLGYEEYAAKSLVLAGIDLSVAVSYEQHFEYVDIDGVQVGTDLRTPDKFDALNFVVSEPYVLDGIEFGWDRQSKSLAYGVYQAQQARFERTGILTAVSEDNIDQAPYFVYNTVFSDGVAWNAVTEKGEDASEFKSLSSKAAIGWYALYDTNYTTKLMDRIDKNYDKTKGWYAGIYELSGEKNKALTANTNAIILESLRYIQFGKMIRVGTPSS